MPRYRGAAEPDDRAARAANPARVRSSARCPDHSGFCDVDTCTYSGPSAPTPALSDVAELTVLDGTPRGSHVVSTQISDAPPVTLPTPVRESGPADTTSLPRR